MDMDDDEDKYGPQKSTYVEGNNIDLANKTIIFTKKEKKET